MTNDVFGSDQTTTNPPEGSPSPTGADDRLSRIVNEDGSPKYKTVDSAFDGLVAGDEHIKKLESENTQLRTEMDKRLSAEQVLAEIKAGNKPDETPSPVVDSEALDKAVDKRLEARTLQQKGKENEDLVQQTLTSKWGEKAQEIAAGKAREMGMSTEDLRVLSQKSPQAVLNMFDLASKTQEGVPSRIESSVRTDGLDSSGRKNYAWYQNLRRENYTEYRRQYPAMMAAAEKEGDNFYN